MPRKYLYLAGFLLVFTLISSGLVQAQETGQEQPAPLSVIPDVMRLAPEMKIVEPIAGDVLLIGGSVEVNAPVAGNVRILGGRVVLNSKVGGNVTVVGGEIVFDKGSDIRGNVFLAGGQALIDGRVRGNIIARLSEGRNLRVSHTAKIEGVLNYRAQSENDNLSQNAAGGGVEFEKTAPPPGLNRFLNLFNLLTLFGLLVAGLFFVSLAPKTMRELINASFKKPIPDLLRGIITLLGVPLLVLFLFLTMIGLPLAVILLVVYVLVIYLSTVFSGLGLGTSLARLAKGRQWSERVSLVWLMAVGVAVIWSLSRVPIIGPLVQLGSIIWGLGLVTRLKWEVVKKIEN